MRYHPYTQLECFSRGNQAETYFQALAKNLGFSITQSSPKEDRLAHIDFHLVQNGIKTSVDIKAMKKIGRTVPEPQDEWIWLELRGVNGSRGWIYGGQAEYIVFELKTSFLFVERLQLIAYLKDLDIQEYTKISTNAKYKLYQRKKRGDLLTLVKRNDLEKISSYNWEKLGYMIPIEISTEECAHITSSRNELFHQQQLENIKQIFSPRLREQRTADLFDAITNFNFCPMCGLRVDYYLSTATKN